MNKLSCIIIDDNDGAHLVINHYISLVKTLSLVESFYDAVEALDYLYHHKIDIIFLDISMPGLSGIEMLEILSIRPNVILTTAHKEYALEGYKHEVVDYLVKPFDFKQFLSAVDKAINRTRSQFTSEFSPELNAIDHLILKVENSHVKLKFSSILYIQSYGNYVKVYTPEKVFLSQITTTEIIAKLDTTNFIRIHRSYIVSLKHISSIVGNQIFMSNSDILPIGKTFKREILSHFK